MPAHINPDESAWFYHSTFDNSKCEKPLPKQPMSQIPGINGCHDDNASDPSKSYYKDTDTKYVRLAKQGGRRDLLNYQEFDKPREAVAYPRVDWYYLEDNALEDAKKKKDVNWKFGVPEYMSQKFSAGRESGDQKHDTRPLELPPNDDDGQARPNSENGSFAEEDSPSNTSKPPMVSGGETQDSNIKKSLRFQDGRNPITSQFNYPNYNRIERVRPVIPEQQFKNPITQTDARNNLRAAGFVKKQENCRDGSQVSMSKLLSHSYAKEWHDQLKDTQTPTRRSTCKFAYQSTPNMESCINQIGSSSSESLNLLSNNNATSQVGELSPKEDHSD